MNWQLEKMTRRSALGLVISLGAGLGLGRARADAASARRSSYEALKSVGRWGIQYQAVDLRAVAASNLDLIALDPSLNDAELRFIRREDCQLLKSKPDGTRRLVLAYLCVGEVDTKRWYWPRPLVENPPAWVGAENVQWPGSRSVQFWTPEWQKLVFDSSDSILSMILDVGYDGVFLDRVDGYGDWEATRLSARDDMVQMVTTLAARARKSDPAFIVVAQNAEPLLANESFVDCIDAHNKESLLTGLTAADTYNSDEDIEWSLNYIRMLHDRGKTTLATEYVSDPTLAREVRSRLLNLSFVPFIGNRALDRLPQDSSS